MSNTDPPGSVTGGYWPEDKERGSRRRKIYGYLKAANEIRQSYQEQWAQRSDDQNDNYGLPGAFPDVEVARNGDEEMVLFPSYARRHVKKKPTNRDRPGAHEDLSRPQSSGDADYWRREWEKFEDDNAIVDVDVRGWIYAPQRGAMNRKNRLLVAVARRLSGIPAPAQSPVSSRASSRHSTHREKYDDSSSKFEEEAAAREAQKIIQHGEEEVQAAVRGGYSEEPSREVTRGDSPYSSRSASPDPREPVPGRIRKALTDPGMASDVDDSASINSKRKSWVPPERMSKEELQIANEHLMARLKPFMTIPTTSAPITVFFFNDQKSQSRTVSTNESGHFNVRAALDFVPTNVRVLASENLSAVAEVGIIEPKGVSLISDIDDTIKHSAIASGAKEIFRNTFIRDLADLTVEGIREWYSKMYSMGVKMHYVSNSPWQLYPLLRSYFGLAGLPPGSFHLKAYTGMLQGIFEPAAERKRGSLERIFRDFPDRKFILVGDSGEADLEVYTDTVLENPGRVLAIFIRDVTTTIKDKEKETIADQRGLYQESESVSQERGSGSGASVRSRASDQAEDRPSLPVRRSGPPQPPPKRETPKQDTGNLIDFDDDEPSPQNQPSSSSVDLAELTGGKRQPPARPAKPLKLRSDPNQREEGTNGNKNSSTEAIDMATKKAPPPPKPRRSVTQAGTSHTTQSSNQGKAPYSTNNGPRNTNQGPPQAGQGFAASAGKQISAAYNALPSLPRRTNSSTDMTSLGLSTSPSSSTSTSDTNRPPPPRPLRRGLSSYPAAAAQYASNRLSWSNTSDPQGGGAPGGPGGQQNSQYPPANPTSQGPQIYNKKEEMWRRRWARAEDMLRPKEKGLVLRTFRQGGDVMDLAVGIVEGELRRQERGERR